MKKLIFITAFILLTRSSFEQVIEGNSNWSNWKSVSDVPYQVPLKALDSVFSVSQTAGIEIDNQIYNIKLDSIALLRHTENDYFDFLRQTVSATVAEGAIKLMKEMPAANFIAICKVYRTENGKIDFKPLLNSVKKNGVILSGLSSPPTLNINTAIPGSKDLFEYKGTVPILRGIFFFGQQYTPWWLPKNSDGFIVELKNAILYTDEAALYGNGNTIIRSQYTGFRIGNCEFQGEAQLSNTGIILLPGTRFRTKESNGQ